MTTIPKNIDFGAWGVPVKQKKLKQYGHFDPIANEIVLRSNQTEVGKHVILIHELLHCIANHLRSHKVIARQPDEKFVENSSLGILVALVNAGLYTGITKKQLKRFLKP